MDFYELRTYQGITQEELEQASKGIMAIATSIPYQLEEMSVFQEASFTTLNTLIDAFNNKHGIAPRVAKVSTSDYITLSTEALMMRRFEERTVNISGISSYRGVSIQVQETFSPGTVELSGNYRKLRED